MGLTQTLLYIAPVLGLQLSLSTRVYISAVIQLLVSLMETVETMFKQVSTSNKRPNLADSGSWLRQKKR